MIVSFKMQIDDELIEFKSIGKLKNNILTFKDMNNKQNTITIEILYKEVVIYQSGSIEMEQTYRLNEKTKGFYHGNFGVKMTTFCFTKELKIEKGQIFIDYDYYSDDNYLSNNKLMIIY